MSGSRRTGSVVLMQGLPASGKSTRAREIQAHAQAAGRQCLVLSRDTVRDMLGVGWHSGVEAEAAVSVVQFAAAEAALAAGVTVVVDDLNLRADVTDRWYALARRLRVPLTVVRVDTDVEECVRRDALRPEYVPGGPVTGRRVGEDVIRRLAGGGTTATQEAIAASVAVR